MYHGAGDNGSYNEKLLSLFSGGLVVVRPLKLRMFWASRINFFTIVMVLNLCFLIDSFSAYMKPALDQNSLG